MAGPPGSFSRSTSRGRKSARTTTQDTARLIQVRIVRRTGWIVSGGPAARSGSADGSDWPGGTGSAAAPSGGSTSTAGLDGVRVEVGEPLEGNVRVGFRAGRGRDRGVRDENRRHPCGSARPEAV